MKPERAFDLFQMLIIMFFPFTKVSFEGVVNKENSIKLCVVRSCYCKFNLTIKNEIYNCICKDIRYIYRVPLYKLKADYSHAVTVVLTTG